MLYAALIVGYVVLPFVVDAEWMAPALDTRIMAVGCGLVGLALPLLIAISELLRREWCVFKSLCRWTIIAWGLNALSIAFLFVSFVILLAVAGPNYWYGALNGAAESIAAIAAALL